VKTWHAMEELNWVIHFIFFFTQTLLNNFHLKEWEKKGYLIRTSFYFF